MIKFQVSGNTVAVIQQPSRITSGTVGLRAEFAFDSQWEGLSKVAMFRAGDVVMTIANPEDGTVVPWEVLEKPNLWLQIGVYGVNGEGTVVIPTVWTNVCVIHTGVNPEDDPALKPTLPVWQEIRTAAMEAINGHIADTANPHKVTAEQLGAAPATELAVLRDAVTALQSAVIDEAQTETWGWRKRLDGTAECWMTHYGSISGRMLEEIIPLPVTFAQVEEQTVTMLSGAELAGIDVSVHCVHWGGIPTMQNPTDAYIQYIAMEDGEVSAEIYIRGKWR